MPPSRRSCGRQALCFKRTWTNWVDMGRALFCGGRCKRERGLDLADQGSPPSYLSATMADSPPLQRPLSQGASKWDEAPGVHGSKDAVERFDKRRRTRNYLWYEAGKRRSKLIGTKQQYPTKAAAWKAVDIVHASVQQTGTEPNASTMQVLVEHYRVEKMATRYNTRRKLRDVVEESHPASVGGPSHHGSAGAPCGNVAWHSRASTEKQSAHSRIASQFVGLRSMVRRCFIAAQSYGTGHG
jgi:hypothetical protein